MAARILSVSLSAELADALDRLRVRRSEERSRLVETLLRENPYVLDEIRSLRAEPSLKKGRAPEDFDRLVRFGKARMEQRRKSGQVKWRD